MSLEAAAERIAYVRGALAGLSGSTRYTMSAPLRSEIKALGKLLDAAQEWIEGDGADVVIDTVPLISEGIGWPKKPK